MSKHTDLTFFDEALTDTTELHEKAAESPLDAALRSTTFTSSQGINLLATVVAIDEQGFPLVEFQRQHHTAQSLVPVTMDDIGKQCLITQPENSPSPVILGLTWQPGTTPEHQNNKHVINAANSITLKCGKSSLQMEQDGTVHLQGVTVTTQAYGANRVKGGAVKIN